MGQPAATQQNTCILCLENMVVEKTQVGTEISGLHMKLEMFSEEWTCSHCQGGHSRTSL